MQKWLHWSPKSTPTVSRSRLGPSSARGPAFAGLADVAFTSSFSSQFLHQLRQNFLRFSLHWALSFRPLRFLFILRGRLAILLQRSISLSFGIALRVL